MRVMARDRPPATGVVGAGGRSQPVESGMAGSKSAPCDHHELDHPVEAHLAAVVGGEDLGDAVVLELFDLVAARSPRRRRRRP